MRKFATVFVVLCSAGCGGVSKKDLDNTKVGLEAQMARAVADLEKKITAIDTKYASMLALDQSVKNGLSKIEGQGRLLEDANKVMTQIVQAQRNSLREQLKSIEDQLEGLSKK